MKRNRTLRRRCAAVRDHLTAVEGLNLICAANIIEAVADGAWIDRDIVERRKQLARIGPASRQVEMYRSISARPSRYFAGTRRWKMPLTHYSLHCLKPDARTEAAHTQDGSGNTVFLQSKPWRFTQRPVALKLPAQL